MDEEQLFGGLEKYMQANDFLRAMVEMRTLYDNLRDIAQDDSLNKAEQFEAQELVKDGFYSFIYKIGKMGGQ